MISYDAIRESFKPKVIRLLFIAESQPPADETIQSSRTFYRHERIRKDDRLFVNTIKALYPEAATQTEAQLEPQKKEWLQRFQRDGYYMIEALPLSLEHEVTKEERQEKIRAELPHLIERVSNLIEHTTPIILIKSNVFVVAAEPLRQAGYRVLNTELLDYPGRFNQRAYREKLMQLLTKL